MLLSTTAFAGADMSVGYWQGATKQNGRGHSFLPVVGYDPVYKFVFGAGYFYRSETFSGSANVNSNFSHVYQIHARAWHGLTKVISYQLKGDLTKGFDPYFGEGGNTDANAFTRLWGVKQESRAQLNFHLGSHAAVGLYAELRTRTEEPGRFDSPTARAFPDENTLGFGICGTVDTRDVSEDPRRGVLLYAETTRLAPSTLRSEASLAAYFPFLAFRVAAGTSDGELSYAFRYRLGGSNRLVGYYDNRFRGRHYYVEQTEVRLPIFKVLSATVFVNVGDATDDKFTQPKFTYGGGIRIGLPPDWISKLRIDFGVGRDQAGFFANFGHTF